MALIACRECGNKISDTAPACPSCGAPHRSPVATRRAGGKWEAWGFVMVVVGLVAMMAGTGWGGALLFAGFVVFLVGRFK